MAKNFVQDGTTIELVNAGDQTDFCERCWLWWSGAWWQWQPQFCGAQDLVAPKACSCCPNSLPTILARRCGGLSEGRDCAEPAADGAVAAGMAWEHAPSGTTTVAVENQCLILRECAAGWTWRPYA